MFPHPPTLPSHIYLKCQFQYHGCRDWPCLGDPDSKFVKIPAPSKSKPTTTTKNPNSTSHLPTPSSSTTCWMWNPRDHEDQDESWEVRAFAEDTSNMMGTTWPPRFYYCSFCRREFRSAQALGGHMNVHRRDRARLHQASVVPHNNNNSNNSNINPISSFSNTPSFLNISHHHQDPFVANGGLCLLYPFPSPNNNNNDPFSSLAHNNNACGDLPSTVFSVSSSHSQYSSLQYSPIRVPSCSATSFDFSVAQPAAASGRNNVFSSYSGKVEQEPIISSSTHHGLHHEELDLELRLGNKSTST